MPRDRHDNSLSLYVSGFKDNIRPSDLAVLFEPFGKIADVYIPKENMIVMFKRWSAFPHSLHAFKISETHMTMEQDNKKKLQDTLLYHDDDDARRVYESGEKFHLEGRKLELQYAQGKRKSPNQMRGGGGRGGDRDRGGRRGRSRSRTPDRHYRPSRRYSRSRSPDRRDRRRDSRSPIRRGGRSRSRSPPRRRSPSPRNSRRSPSPRRRSRSRSPVVHRGRSGSPRDNRRRGSASRSPAPRAFSPTPDRERNMSIGEQGEIIEQDELGGQ
ncbi:hypothetical protein BGZ83_012093 [Gryganskiella cystojenkinii]|nr:hypothetical protein BGZ83_012093 [Gryganskiella cystojenkinii]